MRSTHRSFLFIVHQCITVTNRHHHHHYHMQHICTISPAILVTPHNVRNGYNRTTTIYMCVCCSVHKPVLNSLLAQCCLLCSRPCVIMTTLTNQFDRGGGGTGITRKRSLVRLSPVGFRWNPAMLEIAHTRRRRLSIFVSYRYRST